MSAFARSFLRDSVAEPTRPQGYLALFGKHPGWDDHVEDLPLATASLVFAKQNLYVQGIGGQVSSGGWARLSAEQRLPGFDHVLLWRRGSQFIAGRLWSSTDGKRRAHFPMGAMVHCIHVPPGAALDAILSWLETVESACKATRSSDRIRALYEQCQGDFQSWIGRNEHTESDQPDPVEWGMAPETLAPAVAEILSRGRDLIASRFKERSELPALHFRVPATGGNRSQDLRLWNRILRHTVHESVPQLLCAARDQPWVDVILGEPTVAEILSLQASREAISVITDSTLGAELDREVEGAETFVRRCLLPGTEAVEVPVASQGGGWFSRLLGRNSEP